jgi:hypothetical protein
MKKVTASSNKVARSTERMNQRRPTLRVNGVHRYLKNQFRALAIV